MQTELGHLPQASEVPRPRLGLSLVAWVLGTALLPLAGVLLATLALNHGRFFYRHDDGYNHLALASNIAQGHCGTHRGAVAVPSSGVFWPFLVAPFARFSDFALVPLVLSSALLLAYARLALRQVEQALPAHSPNTQVAMALLVLVATNAVGLVLTGLQHVLQLVCTVWLLAEVHALPRVRRVSRGLVFALILGPLVCYEMLAWCIPAALYVAWLGQRRTAAFGLLGIALSLCAFSAFLVAHGLAPLPASVLGGFTCPLPAPLVGRQVPGGLQCPRHGIMPAMPMEGAMEWRAGAMDGISFGTRGAPRRALELASTPCQGLPHGCGAAPRC
ncbi:MAG: hypothetical protein RL385_471 [Pseudomonadota bacterium]|jgi:hypothetical protein